MQCIKACTLHLGLVSIPFCAIPIYLLHNFTIYLSPILFVCFCVAEIYYNYYNILSYLGCTGKKTTDIEMVYIGKLQHVNNSPLLLTAQPDVSISVYVLLLHHVNYSAFNYSIIMYRSTQKVNGSTKQIYAPDMHCYGLVTLELNNTLYNRAIRSGAVGMAWPPHF